MRDRREEARLTVRDNKTLKLSYLRHHFVRVFPFVLDLYGIGHGIDCTHAVAVVFIPSAIHIVASETVAFFLVMFFFFLDQTLQKQYYAFYTAWPTPRCVRYFNIKYKKSHSQRETAYCVQATAAADPTTCCRPTLLCKIKKRKKEKQWSRTKAVPVYAYSPSHDILLVSMWQHTYTNTRVK